MKTQQLISWSLILLAEAIAAQEFGGVIRILRSSDRVKIGGRSYKVRRTKNTSTLNSNRNGSCVFEGQIFRHGGTVQRKDACDKCMCFSGEVLCWKTQCPPVKITKGCREVRRSGVCCPIIECDPEVPLKNNKHSFTQKKQRPFVPLPEKNRFKDQECEIDGRKYRYGEIVQRASGACMVCRCGSGGEMKCKTRKCPLTGALDLGKLAKVTQNTKTAPKTAVLINQKRPQSDGETPEEISF
ncbi:uncharacterized protein LOC100897568 [Galendromus occidentalis]|uniref:Uncharacterized protein LOC100897568 n=1 Tax=Galendromus occidentalis TaxID=34638 RepID=A0AAJ7WIG7_9ACAR|nr:uncharacterized protein LOC100897568 [Galendromus occidentalis]